MTITINGNLRYWVVAEGVLQYNGNNILKFWMYKFRYRRDKGLTAVKYGRTSR